MSRNADWFLAASSAGAVLSLTVLKEHPLILETLSAITAVVAVGQPLIRIGDTAEKLFSLHAEMAVIEQSFDNLWLNLSQLDDSSVRQTFEKLQKPKGSSKGGECKTSDG